jgi:hypothetical protein
MPERALIPLSQLVAELVPTDWLTAIDDALLFLALDAERSELDVSADAMRARFRLYVLRRIQFDLPLIAGATLQLGRDGAFPRIDVALRLDPIVEVDVSTLELTLHLPPSILRTFERAEDSGEWRAADDIEGYAFTWTTGLRATMDGTIDLRSPTVTDLRPAMIADTGFILDLGEIRVITGTRPADLSEHLPDYFKGVWVDRLSIHYQRPGSRFNPSFNSDRASIGDGGFSGTVSLGTPAEADAGDASPTDTQLTELFAGDDDPRGRTITVGERAVTLYPVQLEGMRVALEHFGVTFVQSVPAGSRLIGYIFVPFADKWLRLEASLGGPDGNLVLDIGGAGQAGLIDLDNEFFEIVVDSLRYELRHGVNYAVIAGTVRPKIGGLDWPGVKVERLSVGSNGDLDIDGGWIDVPETLPLDFHGFKIDIDQVGMGSEEATGRQWFGFSGGIRLIEGIPLNASVQGLRVSWNPATPPTASEPMRGIKVSLEGIGVHLEIPGTLVLDGAVRYREILPPPPTRPSVADSADAEAESAGVAAGVFGHTFTGSITLDIQALNMEIAGELIIGDLTEYSYDASGSLQVGESFTALFIVLAADLPTALPLGATGTGLYGINGLFGMHIAPDRHLDAEGEPESWYLWYKTDRGNHSESNVTKVVKWTPRFDNYGFGAGLTIGTVHDDGFTLNVAALAAILLPGPVVMIEGRANLLKPRGGRGTEGALYALLVFDGLAETFQMNVDVNLTMEDVITVGGGLEAFFDFNDGDNWFIHIGKRDPETKRIRAEILSIVTAKAYLMIEPPGIKFGAAAGLDLQVEYGPLEIKLILRITLDVDVDKFFWREPQITGAVELYLELSIRVCGIGLGLILQTVLEASAPQPWWIHGLARAALDLPFPLPSFDVEVEFSWGQAGEPAVVDLIKGASFVHPKLPGAAWALPELPPTPESDWPIVPVDAIPVLSLAKRLSNISMQKNEDGTAVDWFRHETTEGIEFSYELTDLRLKKKDDRGIFQDERILSASNSGLRLRPDQYALEPQAELWWYGPLDTYDLYSRRNYRNPCPQPSDPERHCVDWRRVAVGTVYSSSFSHRGLTFAIGFNQRAIVERVPPASATRPDRGLAIRHLIVRFPEPVAQVTIEWGTGGEVTAFSAGRAVALTPDAAIDTLHVDPRRGDTAPSMPVITSICYVTQRELRASGEREDGGDRSVMSPTLVLEPYRSYQLEVTGVRRERRPGETRDGAEDPRQTKIYRFRTGGLPGTDYGEAQRFGLVARPPDFANGPLNRIESYVKRTVPRNGAPLYYRGYDVLVELKDPYAAAMLAPVLDVRVVDRNGTPVGAPSLLYFSGDLPFLTPGLLAFLTAQRETACAGVPVPWTRQILDRYVACALPEETRPQRMYRVVLTARFPHAARPVYGFEFATSRFRDAREHLGSGLQGAAAGAERGRQLLRSLGTAPPPPLSWIERMQSRIADLTTLRERLAAALTVGEHDAGTTIEQASADIVRLRGEFGAWNGAICAWLDRGGVLPLPWSPAETLSYDGIHALFVTAGSGHRPLPPRAVETLAIHTGSGFFILLESPEPLDWSRLTLTRADTGAALPVVWSEDGTRAFIFDAGPGRLFAIGGLTFRLSFNRGGASAPDLDPLYRGGELPPVEDVIIWDLVAA